MSDAERITDLERRLAEAQTEAAKWKDTALTIQTNLAHTLHAEWLRGHTEGFEDNGKALDLVVAEHDAAKSLLAAANERAASWNEIINRLNERILAAESRCADLERERDEAEAGRLAALRGKWVGRDGLVIDPIALEKMVMETLPVMQTERDKLEARVKELESQNADLDEQVANNDAERGEALEKLTASESRLHRVEALLEMWRRNRADPRYGTGTPGPLYAAGMATEADSMIAGLAEALAARAVLAGKLPTGTTPETQEDDLPCGIRDGCHNCANRVGETCTVQGDPMPISSDGGIECPLQCVLPSGALPEALDQQEQDARNLDAVGPARDAPSAGQETEPEICASCSHTESHHYSPIANGRCEGELERCGCSKFCASIPETGGKEEDHG